MVTLEMSWQAAGISAGFLAAVSMAARRARRPSLVTAAAFAAEAGLLFARFALWQLAGSHVLMSPEGAAGRGEWIWHAERAVHMPSETLVQRAFLAHPLIVQALNLYYAGLHFSVIIAWLIWVFLRHRRQYPQVRTALVLFTAGALLIQFIPVAPPRMLPADGMVDTAVRYGQSVYGSVAGSNADQLSAMPSVHVGWALLVALVIVHLSGSRWRWLALGYPALTVLAVTVTANHYWLDGAAAAMLLALSIAAQRAGRAVGRRVGGRVGPGHEGRSRPAGSTVSGNHGLGWGAEPGSAPAGRQAG